MIASRRAVGCARATFADSHRGQKSIRFHSKSNYYLHDLNDVTEQSIIKEKSIKVTCFVQFENIDPNIRFVESDDSYQGTVFPVIYDEEDQRLQVMFI